MRRALKKHVLEQMCESGPARFLVCRPDMVPEVHRDDWRGMILGKSDEKPVIKVEGFYRNSHCRKLPAMQTHWNPLAMLL
jgi:hypothetical protein